MTIRRSTGHEKPVLTTAEVADLFGVQKRTIGDWVRKGTFPPPVKMSSQVHIWRREAIEAAILEREAEAR